ncbi:MAG: CotH kinase family protein, partial [Planctomycetota bacterium]
DEDDEPCDWIELWNRGAKDVELHGWSLSDDPHDARKWTFPPAVLRPGQFLVVYASGKDRDETLHTNFKLQRDGEFLGLYSRRGILVQRQGGFPERFPKQRDGYSFGLDGHGPGFRYRYLSIPSPGYPNEGPASIGFTRSPRFSRGSEVVEVESIALELSTATPRSHIRYTLDGSLPNANNGRLYRHPIRIEAQRGLGVITVHARAFSRDRFPSEVSTRSFIFPSEVISQPIAPLGFPPHWGGHHRADYEMDPDLSFTAEQRQRLNEGLRSIPSLSISASVEDIFGVDGIYSHPEERGADWERPCSFDWIDPNGDERVQIQAGIRLRGSSSRTPRNSPKHSFRISFRARYRGALKSSFFSDVAGTHHSLVLRAAYNNSWIHPNENQRRRAQYLRDQWVRDTMRALGHPSPRGRPVHLYICGLYWGVYNVVESPDEHFAAEEFGGSAADYEVVKADKRSSKRWRATLDNLRASDPNDPASYEAIENEIDIDAFIDYMAVNLFAGNNDWPRRNWYALRKKRRAAKWHFVIWDAERVLEGSGDDRVDVDAFGSPGEIFANLRRFTEFRVRFADRVLSHLTSNGALSESEATSRWRTLSRKMRRAIVCESARWGDFRSPGLPYTTDEHWTRENRRIAKQYFRRRGPEFLAQLRQHRLFPETDAPKVFVDPVDSETALVTMSETSGLSDAEIVFTLDGRDPRTRVTDAPAAESWIYRAPLRVSKSVAGQIRARVLSRSGWSALRSESTERHEPKPAHRSIQVALSPIPARDRIGLRRRLDLDDSGHVDILDAVELSAFVLGIDTEAPCGPATIQIADANLDGAVSLIDVVVLLEELFGRSSSFNPECVPVVGCGSSC